MRRFLRDNGLSLVLLALFLLCWAGQTATGWQVDNHDRLQHGTAALSLGAYLGSAHFLEATAENWESEFLQMAVYVLLTALLFQRGSAESRDPDGPEETGEVGGGLWRWLYSYSLTLVLFGLFLLSFALHGMGGFHQAVREAAEHGDAVPTASAYVTGSQFWFESLQNWQSEFLSVLAIVVLSIFLRHRGSPESKPVDMPHRDTP